MAFNSETSKTEEIYLTIVLYYQKKFEAFLDLYWNRYRETMRVRIKFGHLEYF